MKYEKLYKTRVELGVTQSDIALELGISKAFYCQIENKQRRLNYPMALEIAKVLGKKPDDLFYEEILKDMKK